MIKRINDIKGHEYITHAGIAPVTVIVEGVRSARIEVLGRSPTSVWLPHGSTDDGRWVDAAKASANVFIERGVETPCEEESYW